MKSELKKQMRDFFGQMDWPKFYQSKMAVCEIMDRFIGSEEAEERNAVEWLNVILEMMDAMGDIAENMGLFVYPEWDDDINCMDERYNHVLSKLPADVVPASEAATEALDNFLVTLRRTRYTDVMNPDMYEDDYIVRIPKSVQEEERTEYIENVFRGMAHEMLTGPNGVAYIHATNRDFNWGDVVNDVTNDIQEKYRCYDTAVPDNRKWLRHCGWNRIIVDVNQDEILLWEEEPCTIYINGHAVCEALANMVTGEVCCRQEVHLDDEQEAFIVFAEGGQAKFPLSKNEIEEGKEPLYYWLRSN